MAPKSSRFFVPPAPARRRPARSVRLRIAHLEDRTVPALFNVQSPLSISGLNNNGCVATADLNKDGLEDAILTNFGTDYGTGAGRTITILYGKSGGGFLSPISLNTGGTNPSFVTIADINGDGYPDAVVTNENGQGAGSFSVFQNDGHGNLSLAHTYSTSSNNPSWIGLADITGDGQLDAVVGSFGKDDGTGENITGNNITIFQGNGDFTFNTNPVATLTPDISFFPTALAVADFNGDGIMDIAAAVPGVPPDSTSPQPDGTVYVFQGQGGGAFADPNQYDTGGALPVNIQADDLNGDGKPDLIVANAGDPNNTATEFANNSVGVILNASNPSSVTFGVTNSLTANCHGTFAVAVADFNMDGKPDIAAINYGSELGTSPAAFVSAYKGDGTGSFVPFAPGTFDTQTGAGGGQYLAVGDFNGDGSPDLIVSHVTPEVGLLLNTTVPAPTINQAVGQTDPTNGSSINFDVTFPSGVTGFDASDIDLSGSTNGGAGLTPTVTAIDASHYTVAVTGMAPGTTGIVKATFPAGAATVISSGNPTPAPNSTDNQVTYDYIAPTVAINQAAGQADPTTTGPIKFTVVFSEPVTGFTASDVDLSSSTVGGTLSASVSGSGTTYNVSVTGMSGSGTVVATVPASVVTDVAGNQNLASTSTDNTVTFGSAVAPTVTINQAAGQADPTNASPVTFAVHFSDAVTGFVGSDVQFTGSTVGGTLSASVSGSGQDYTVTVTGMNGTGTVVASIPANSAVNSGGTGNQGSTSTDNTVTFDNVPPSVTVNQAFGQADPTNVSSIRYDVIFSEPVTGFDGSKVSFAGSTVGGTLVASVAGSGTTYMVTVTGETTRGSVVLSVPAGVVTDAVGNPNTASTGTDNTVEFLNTGTLSFSQAVYQASETGLGATVTITVTRNGQTDGAVSIDYATGDGTAKHGGSPLRGLNDYVPASGTKSWADGVGGSQTFTVQIQPDSLNEGTELINLRLTNPVGSPGLGTATSVIAIAPSNGKVLNKTTPTGRFTDSDGDTVTVRLGGNVLAATATVFLTDPNGIGAGPIELIQLNGTDPTKSNLSISVVKSKTSADGGTVNLGAITGSGLRSISARRANLVGEPIDLTGYNGIDLSGYLGSIVLGNIADGTHLKTGGTSNPLQKTRINALAIGAASITIGAPVSSLTAASFGAGSFTAPSAGSIVIRGNMSGDININGIPDPTKKSLGTLRVRGEVSGSDIMVTGNVGAVVVGGFNNSRLFAGYVGPDVPDSSGSGFNYLSTINSFRNTGLAGAFQDSRVIATNVMSAFLRNVTMDNGGNAFGFFAQNTVVRLTLAGPPVLTYVPADGNLWTQTDFVVETQI